MGAKGQIQDFINIIVDVGGDVFGALTSALSEAWGVIQDALGAINGIIGAVFGEAAGNALVFGNAMNKVRMFSKAVSPSLIRWQGISFHLAQAS